MPGIKTRDCRAGDIILFYDLNIVSAGLGFAKAAKGLTVLPAVISAAQGGSNAIVGSATANHAGIVCGEHEPFWDLAHATNADGVHREDLSQWAKGCSGTVQVFRLKILPGTAGAAAKVANNWAEKDDENNVGMKFSKSKGGLCALRSSMFGPGAKERAQFYRANKDRKGGPVDWKNWERGTHKSMFCSMFVVACYQAALEDYRIEQVLALDAKNTSPMYLDGYLRNSPHWETVGALDAN
jgi:hypothetical protein